MRIYHILSILMLALLFQGCKTTGTKPHKHEGPPLSAHSPCTPLKTGRELTVGGKPFRSVGWLDLFDRYLNGEPDQSIREGLRNIRRVSNGKVNAVRFLLTPIFRKNAMCPWVKRGDKWNLQEIDQLWLLKFEQVIRICNEEGLCAIPAVLDGWTLRDKGRLVGWHDSSWLNPANQLDVEPRLFNQLDFDYDPEPCLLTRNIIFAPVPDHNPCNGVRPWGHSMVTDNLFRAVARASAGKQVIIELGNELFSTDLSTGISETRAEYDVPMWAAWMDRMNKVIQEERPGTLTMMSTSNHGGFYAVNKCEDGQYCEIYCADLALHCDIMDVHALSMAHPESIKNNMIQIARAVSFIHRRAPDAAVVINSDGCVELERERRTSEWVAKMASWATLSGAYPEAIIEGPLDNGPLEGLR